MVLAADAAAHRAGLRVGMPATKAQALVPGLIVKDADLSADGEALDRLALWALRLYAPVVAADPPDGLVIDTTGADHLHGGEEAMVKSMVDRLAASGFAGRAALADSWGAAHAFARYVARPVSIVPKGASAATVLNLPIAALRLPQEMLESLRVLGFDRIGELAEKPRPALALRFGPELGRRLDQAMGRVSEPIDPVRAPDLIEVRRVFAEPIAAAETIARYTGKLVILLCEELEAKGLGAKRLDLLFHLVDNRIEAIRIGTALPVRDGKRLTRLLCEKIETIDPGFGIEIMRLAATLAEPLAPKQTVSSLTEEPEADISGLVDTLVNRVGDQRLYRFAPVASDVPERSVRRIAPTAPDMPLRPAPEPAGQIRRLVPPTGARAEPPGAITDGNEGRDVWCALRGPELTLDHDNGDGRPALAGMGRPLSDVASVDRHTIARWRHWWRDAFTATPFLTATRHGSDLDVWPG